jgi:hypothetical protein
MSEFPGYQVWVDMLAQRDLTILSLFELSGLVIIYLLYAKYKAPRWLPIIRLGCFALFYGSLLYKIAEALLRA